MVFDGIMFLFKEMWLMIEFFGGIDLVFWDVISIWFFCYCLFFGCGKKLFICDKLIILLIINSYDE